MKQAAESGRSDGYRVVKVSDAQRRQLASDAERAGKRLSMTRGQRDVVRKAAKRAS